jgi:hypothetical protein
MRIFLTKPVFDIIECMKENFSGNRSELIRTAIDDFLEHTDHKKAVIPRRNQKNQQCGITLPDYYISNIKNAFPETYIGDVIQYAAEVYIEKTGEKDVLETYKERLLKTK